MLNINNYEIKHEMYTKLCIKKKLYVVNKYINGYWNFLPVNGISLTCDKTIPSHSVVILREVLIFETVGP